MLQLNHQSTILSMSPKHQPIAHAKSGDIVIFETKDCFSNNIRKESDLFHTVGWDKINPATGPLSIDDAKAGNVLKVEILDVKIDDQGVMTTAPDLGPLGSYYDREKTKVIYIKDGVAIFNEKVSLPINPMIGVIGTAPEKEDIPTGTPGVHGANMDCKRIVKGSIVYLPVNIDGAMLAMGDIHAVMGDGEVCLSGVEISGEITVRVTVLQNSGLPTPLIIQGDDVMIISSAPTLNEASKMASVKMASFVSEKFSLDFDEAAMLITFLGNLKTNQIVNPLMTARYEMPLWVFEKYNYKFL